MRINTTTRAFYTFLWLCLLQIALPAQCDNLTDGGSITGDEAAYGAPFFDPAPILNESLPSGGSGEIQYLWVKNIGTPDAGISEWTPISGSNSADYDPSPISQTTHYMRCARRAGCVDYIAESNFVTKTFLECDDVTSGGLIGLNQEGDAPYDANILVNLVTPAGGSGNLEYLWFMSNVGPPFIQGSPNWQAVPDSNNPNLDPGILNDTTYYIRCVRRAGCEDFLTESNIVTIIVNPTDMPCDDVTGGGMIGFNQENCGGFDPAELVNTVLPSGGSGDLEYLWFTSTVGPPFIQDSPDWQPVPDSDGPNLDPGFINQTTYFIRCVRRAGCEEFNTESNFITLTVFPTVSLQASIMSDLTCPDAADAALAAEAAGGTAPFTFVWNNGIGETQNPTDLVAGSYTVTVTDANGCTDTAAITIDAIEELTATANVQNPDCADNSSGSITTEINGGTAPYDCVWNDPNMTAGTTLNNLPAGTYTLTCTDANGCIFTETYALTDPTANEDFTINIDTQSAACLGQNDGSATATVVEPGDYSFLWNDANSTMNNTLTGVPAGTYTVLVTPADGCPQTQLAVIGNQFTLTLQFEIENETCPGAGDGTVSATVQGGIPPYTLQWDDANNTTGPLLENVGAGIYFLSVTDGNGCTINGEAQVNSGIGLTLNLSQQNVSCNGANDGFAVIQPDNGAAPYMYAWDNVNSNNNTVSGLTAGSYAVTVTDANGCTGEVAFVITEPEAIGLTLIAGQIMCADDETNIISLISGGIAPYTYAWDTGATTENLQNIGIGSYALTVTDANNCTALQSITLDALSDLAATATASDALCFGENTGTATVTPAGGSPSYSVLWSTGETTMTVENLATGDYSVTVTDNDGCQAAASVTVNEPPVFTVTISILNNVSTQSGTDGSLTAIPAGGTPGYTYLWSTGATGMTVGNLSAGTYSVTATDANGCTSTAEITLPDGENTTVEIGDYVFFDGNADGIQQPFESGVAQVTVNLVDADTGNIIATQTTNNDGFYLFTNVQPGEYFIEFVLTSLPDNTVITEQNVGNNDAMDSDANATTGQTEIFTVTEGQEDNLTIDAGIRFKCLNVDNGGSIAANQEICPGDTPALLTNAIFPTGGSGTLEYLWLQSNVPQYNGPGDPNWSEIPGSNAPNYQPGALTETTYFIRCARRECCTDYPGETNIINVTVNDLPVAVITNAFGTGCTDESYTLEALASASNAQYAWNFGENALPQTSDLREVDDIVWTTAGEKTVTLTVTRDGCVSMTSIMIEIENCNGLNGGFQGLEVFIDQNEDAALVWHTRGDDRNGTFFIEHAKNGFNFQTINRLDGNADYNPVALNVYTFTHESPAQGMNYYRIRQVRQDGTQALSDTEILHWLPAESAEIRVFPNPFHNKMTVNVLLPQEQEMLLQVMSPQGHILFTEILPAETTEQVFDLSDFPSGLYVVRVYYGYGGQVTEKVFKR